MISIRVSSLLLTSERTIATFMGTICWRKMVRFSTWLIHRLCWQFQFNLNAPFIFIQSSPLFHGGTVCNSALSRISTSILQHSSIEWMLSSFTRLHVPNWNRPKRELTGKGNIFLSEAFILCTRRDKTAGPDDTYGWNGMCRRDWNPNGRKKDEQWVWGMWNGICLKPFNWHWLVAIFSWRKPTPK